MGSKRSGALAGGRRLSLAVTLLVAVAAPPPARTQSFEEAVDVRVVNVDVFVSDKKGRPIEGLTRDDFVLYEDGVEVEITNFYAGSASAEPTTIPAVAEGEVARAELPRLDLERPPLWAVLYLDNFSLDPADRARILDDLERFTAAHAGEDVRFLLATNDLGFRAQTGFTRDGSVLVAAIQEAGTGSAAGVQERVEYETLQTALQGLIEVYKNQPGCADPCVCAWGQMVDSWRVYASSASGRIGVSLNSLGELVSSLGGLSGRKAVFYVSSGLMQNPGIGVLKYLGDLCPHLEQNTTQLMWEFDETSRLEELAARANANRVTLYMVDGGGLRADAAASVDHADIRFRPSSLTHRIRTANRQGSLQFLAEQTGGRAILDANQPFADLEEAAVDFTSFYSLGFSPSRQADGGTHELELALRDKRKADLRYRRVYRDKPVDERLGDRLMATLKFGVDDNPLAVTATTGAPVALGGNQFEVPVHIRLPADRLVTTGQEGGMGRVRVFLAAEDERGRRTALKEKLIELDGPTGKPPADHEMIVSMRLRRGHHRISIGVRDEVGVELSLVRIAVDVERSAAAVEG